MTPKVTNRATPHVTCFMKTMETASGRQTLPDDPLCDAARRHAAAWAEVTVSGTGRLSGDENFVGSAVLGCIWLSSGSGKRKSHGYYPFDQAALHAELRIQISAASAERTRRGNRGVGARRLCMNQDWPAMIPSDPPFSDQCCTTLACWRYRQELWIGSSPRIARGDSSYRQDDLSHLRRRAEKLRPVHALRAERALVVATAAHSTMATANAVADRIVNLRGHAVSPAGDTAPRGRVYPGRSTGPSVARAMHPSPRGCLSRPEGYDHDLSQETWSNRRGHGCPHPGGRRVGRRRGSSDRQLAGRGCSSSYRRGVRRHRAGRLGPLGRDPDPDHAATDAPAA